MWQTKRKTGTTMKGGSMQIWNWMKNSSPMYYKKQRTKNFRSLISLIESVYVYLCISRQWWGSCRARPEVGKKKAFSCMTWSLFVFSSVFWTNQSLVSSLSICRYQQQYTLWMYNPHKYIHWVDHLLYLISCFSRPSNPRGCSDRGLSNSAHAVPNRVGSAQSESIQ